jgi:hypothetical protein
MTVRKATLYPTITQMMKTIAMLKTLRMTKRMSKFTIKKRIIRRSITARKRISRDHWRSLLNCYRPTVGFNSKSVEMS